MNSSDKKMLLIVLPICAVIFITAIVIAVMLMTGGGSAKKEYVTINVDPISQESTSDSIVLSGTISTKKSTATLRLNGEIVEVVMPAEEIKMWNKTVTLNQGTNTFNLVLTDSDNHSVTSVQTINYTKPDIMPKGTQLVKSVADGIYVRPTPAIGNKHVILIDRSDYTTRLTYMGENTVGSDGFTWYKVSTPSNGIGWVRSDIVKIVE